MTQAYKRVVSNAGASGIDGMKASELRTYINEAWVKLRADLLTGTYQPQPVRRVEIPKPNGGTRLLGIPTITDRLIQQAIAQELSLLWETTFSPYSYGFRPQRNTYQALAQAQIYINEGNKYIVDIDLEKFFDRVNHDYLMHLLRQRVSDKRVLSLIGKYLRTGVMIGGIVSKSEKGTPQGSPLSPLLSNIVLDVLDKELEKRGHKFVRYADDFSIYCTSKRGAERVQKSITDFISKKLHLQVNESKSGIRKPMNFIMLGFGFYIKAKSSYGFRVAPKSIKRLKEKIKELTQRKYSKPTQERITSLNKVQQGWIQYFKIADCKKQLRDIDSWTRCRLRMCEWKLWKRVRTRVKRLVKTGVNLSKALQWGNTRKGYWRTAHSPILTDTLGYDWFKSQGYVSMQDLYAKGRKGT